MADKARLANPIRGDLSERLRLAAVLAGQTVGDYLDALLEKQLPSRSDLAELIRAGGAADANC